MHIARRRARSLAVGLGFSLFVAGCASSSASNPLANIGGTQACGGSGAGFVPACDACVLDTCRTELQAASGTDPKSFGGACADYDRCNCSCGQDGGARDSCQQQCQASMTDTCKTAYLAAMRCGLNASSLSGPCKTACAQR
jgi:hypothetical protein